MRRASSSLTGVERTASGVSARTAITAGAILVFLAVLLALSAWNARPVPDDEIARRVRDSRPTWQNYPEDIKAQVGARLAAEWQGEPVAAESDGVEIRVTFRLHGPWKDRDQAFPVLLEEPLGGIHQNTAAAIRTDMPDTVVYVFPLGDAERGMPIPWIHLKFPHGERRIVLSNGAWRADG